MEKTKFKLNYIHTHVKRSRLFKARKKPKSQTSPTLSSCSTASISLYQPTMVYRVNHGLLCFLSELTQSQGYISFSALMLHSLQIKEIRMQNQFVIGIFADKQEPLVDLNIFLEKMLASGSSGASDLAVSLGKYWDRYQDWEMKGRMDLILQQNLGLLRRDLLNQQTEPIIIFHHNKDEGRTIGKVRMNYFLKDLVMKTELELVREGVLLIPCEEYFRFMKDFLEGCFLKKNHVFNFYMQTFQGVQKVYAHLFQEEIDGEALTILYFPKNEQSLFVQKLYDVTNKRISDRKEMKEPRLLPKKISNKEDWNQIIKRYYESWLVKEAQKVCSYKELEDDQ